MKDSGFELVMTGASVFMLSDLETIFASIISHFRAYRTDCDPANRVINVPSLGSFTFKKSDPSWNTLLLLGAIESHGTSDFDAFQIVPDKAHTTIDVPDQAVEWNSDKEPVWRWLRDPWNFPVSPTSTAVTNLAALHGSPVTEAARWEEDSWELFAGSGPDTPIEDVRIVPLGTLLAYDPSLEPIISLSVGEAMSRDPGDEWHEWKAKSV